MNAPHDPIALRLGNCRNSAELRNTVESLCADFGEVLNVTLLCGNDTSDKRLCVIDLIPGKTDIQTCAQHLGGRVFGFSSVIIDLILHPEFACPRGLQADTPGCSCVPKA